MDFPDHFETTVQNFRQSTPRVLSVLGQTAPLAFCSLFFSFFFLSLSAVDGAQGSLFVLCDQYRYFADEDDDADEK